MKEFVEQASKRWPKLTRKERERGAVLLRRLAHLKSLTGNENNDWNKQEVGALEWVMTLIDEENEVA